MLPDAACMASTTIDVARDEPGDVPRTRHHDERIQQARSETGNPSRHHRGEPLRRSLERVARRERQAIAEGDPQVKKLATSEIEAKLEEWIKSCVVKHDEQRFGAR